MKQATNLLATALLYLISLDGAFAQGTTFTYQGRLTDECCPATGLYDLVFRVYDSPDAGTSPNVQVGNPFPTNRVPVTNGLFTVYLNFDSPGNAVSTVFSGGRRWLQIDARSNDMAQSFVTLLPRVEITPTPYALYAANAKVALTASNVVTGGVSAPQLNTPVAPASGQVLSYNGTSLMWTNAGNGGNAPAGWLLSGNAGTTPGTSFLGTLDNQPLELKVNGLRAARVEPAGDSLEDSDTGPDGAPNVILGAPGNYVAAGAVGAAIAGGGATNFNGLGYSNSVLSSFGAIGGGVASRIAPGSLWSTIGGGNGNDIGMNASASAIGGGSGNSIGANSASSSIAGGVANRVAADARASAIGGGENNTIQAGANDGVIAGGELNVIEIDASNSSISGGFRNIIRTSAYQSTVGGGSENTIAANAQFSAIAGGSLNTIAASSQGGAIGGGARNVAGPFSGYLTLGGGYSNVIGMQSAYCTIGGGFGNLTTSNAAFTTIGGGQENVVSGQASTVSGGAFNIAVGLGATVGGGGGIDPTLSDRVHNQAWADWSTVSGGASNTVFTEGRYGTIGGGFFNRIRGNWSTIGGGEDNLIDASGYATIGGGADNFIIGGASYSVIDGGADNGINADAAYCVIGGGIGNAIQASASCTTVGGGFHNTVESQVFYSTIGGGGQNAVMSGARYAVVGGGFNNRCGGQYATVPGGSGNTAIGDFSFAAGRRAKANHPGAFIWADSSGTDFASGANDEFALRARGGVRVSPDTPAINFGSQTRQMLNLWGTQYGIGVQEATLYSRSAEFFAWHIGGSHTDTQYDPGAGGTRVMLLNSVGNLFIPGALNPGSDRHSKTNLQAVNRREILERLLSLPIQRWRYKADPTVPHVGPMAQDFYQAFAVGSDDKHIATIDADGVALAAIQGLNQKLEAALEAKEARLAELEARLEKLERLLNDRGPD